MKDRISRKRRSLSSSSSSSSSFWLPFFALLCCALFFTLAFSTFRLFGVSFRPVLTSTWQPSALNAISDGGDDGDATLTLKSPPPIKIQAAVSFPDSVLIFINNHKAPPSPLHCLYYLRSSKSPSLNLPPISPPNKNHNFNFFIRCPPPPAGSAGAVSLSLLPPIPLAPVQPFNWDHLAYSSLLDPRDNTTIVFAKGFTLRPARLADPARFQCVFGFHFSNPRYALATNAVSAAQETFRCKTPLSVLSRLPRNPPLVSIKTTGRGSVTLPSVARPESLSPRRKPQHAMCICTMVRNQARFLREWVAYHSSIGVERWFIYDNNSDDDIEQVVRAMASVSLHEWPWVKTQEAGFAHCAVRARGSCEWVGFIDVDEFLYLPGNRTLREVLANYSAQPWIGELRTACHSFGPSGRTAVPRKGVMVGYTCRMAAPERHKSIVRPDALNPSLINIVHHFHLREGKRYVNLESRMMVINHYKYQVWEVFKEKFYRRVATYVADWQDEENVGSKDRAPGLGTKAVEPADWSTRFCEVYDTGLRDRVLRVFADRNTGLLPW